VDSLPQSGPAHDPKLAGELAVVLMLRRSAEATAPDPAARDRMRTKLFERLAEPEQLSHPEQSAQPEQTVRPSPVPRTAPAKAKPRKVTGTRGRLVIALSAAFCLLLALSGMTLFLSRNALPGDPLYAVRRTVESASLGLTMGDQAKGLKHLEYAADRISDVESLVARYPDAANSPVGDYLTAFADFDSDTTAGTAELTGYASKSDPGTLTTLRDWATQQASRIKQVEPGLPPTARSRADQSVTLLDRITQRANALAARDNCYTVTTGSSDDLGVLPATGPCDQPPSSNSGPIGSPAGRTVAGQTGQSPAPQGGSGGTVSNTQAPAQPPKTTTFPTPVVTPPPVVPPGPTTTTTKPGITLPLPIPGLNIPGLPLQIGQ
jgi:hypothetical protein